MGDRTTRLKHDKDIQLGVRLGIHTGLVVVGAMGGQGRHEQLALGETPNIAARLQGLAAPNTMAISEATYRLVQGYFDCQDLGAQTLRGVAEPVHVYRVLQDSGARGRLDIAQPRGLTPLVGREQEVGLLLERWEQVKAGHGHVVLLRACRKTQPQYIQWVVCVSNLAFKASFKENTRRTRTACYLSVLGYR